VLHSEREIAATIADIDGVGDEAALRGSVERARQALVTELNAHTPTPTLAAAWSEVMRHSVAAAARLVAHDRQLDWTWFVALRRHRSAVS
jgi:CBS domain-containing protein